MKLSVWSALALAGAAIIGQKAVRAEEAPKEKPKEERKTEAPKDGEFTGKATHTQTGLPILEVGETRYRLKASEKGGDAIKATIEKIGKGEVSGEYKAKGKVSDDERGKKWIAVDSLEPVEKK